MTGLTKERRECKKGDASWQRRPGTSRARANKAATVGTGLMDRHEAISRDQVGRAVGIVGLISIALIHFLDAFSAFDESKFVFGLYILLMIVTLFASAILLRTDSRLTWMLAGATAGLTMIGFILTRTIGLPGFPDNVGNWLEPLGLASLWVEGLVLVLSVYEVLTTPPLEEG